LANFNTGHFIFNAQTDLAPSEADKQHGHSINNQSAEFAC